MNIRIGHGYDVHCFKAGDHIMLCGTKIAHNRAFEAHSDGDVALHAITDAILGAAAKGDIGRHFPDTDEQWSGACSKMLLNTIWQPLSEEGYRIINLDVTIAAQAPKLAPHIEQMEQSVADCLAIKKSQVNVKATTTEKLGFVGRKEGIEVHCVVLLEAPNGL